MANETDTVAEVSEAQPDLDAWANQKTPPAAEEPEGDSPADQDAELERIAARDQEPKNKPAAKPPIRRQKPADAKPPEAKPAPYDPKAMVTMTIDGEQFTDTIENWLRNSQKNGAAERRFQEADKAKKEAEALKELLTKDQRAALKQMGIDPLEFASKLVGEEIERERLAKENPSELRAREAEAKTKALEAEREAERNQAKEAEKARAAQYYKQQYDAQFSQALAKADLPATPYTISRMATLMQQNLERGLELTADEISTLVREDLSAENAATIGKLKAEQAVKLLPKSFLDDLRKYDLAQVKNGGNKVRGKPPAPLPTQGRVNGRARTTSQKEASDYLENVWARGRR